MNEIAFNFKNDGSQSVFLKTKLYSFPELRKLW